MTRLALRRGTVVSLERPGDLAELTVEVAGERRPAVALTRLTGPVEVGDDVVVNVSARDLGLGGAEADILHANLSRGLEGTGEPGAHVMKLNFSPLQHAVHPVEEVDPEGRPAGRGPVAVIALHGQLPCVAWAAAEEARRRSAEAPRIGYVQTHGGALPGELSRVVRDLRHRGLLAGHITAGPAFGGEHEAVSTAGALSAGLGALGWHAAIAGPGPGILGSSSRLGHGGMAALDAAHAALGLGSATVIVPRMSSSDPRERHRGLSHHTETVLELLLRPVSVAVPPDAAPTAEDAAAGRGHEVRRGAADLEGYRDSGLPATTMGRGIDEDPLFFAAGLAGGAVLGGLVDGV